jgi:CRP/FNR family cyclic AMP-dependent transcriptional regulator
MMTNFGEFLQRIPTFAEFGPQEVAVLEKAMVVDQYPDGYEFIGEDKRGQATFLIVEGEVVATHRRIKLRGYDVYEHLGPGDLFGLVGLIDHRPEWATYRAVGPVTAASLPYNVFDLLFTADAPIAHHFQYLIALQLAHDLRNCARTLAEEFANSLKG